MESFTSKKKLLQVTFKSSNNWNDVDIRPDVSVRLARESLVQWQQVRRKQQQMQAISTHSSGFK
jgi:hypothetical protein